MRRARKPPALFGDAPAAADAIGALDGDRPRRVRAAVALAAAGYAPTMVIVRGDNAAPELLRSSSSLPFEVVSFAPDPPSTRGEARGIAALVQERGWTRIVVVTSTFHVFRARLILRRALACDVRLVAAGMNRRRLPQHLASEVAKLLLALTLRRSA
jgi:uncharacterized SAM-binding protein YcdF (DUF218 family)